MSAALSPFSASQIASSVYLKKCHLTCSAHSKTYRTLSFPPRKRRILHVVDYREDSDDDQAAQLSSDDDGEWGQPVKKSKSKRFRARGSTRWRKSFRFLDLPAEIRIMIYKDCFDQTDGPYWIGEVDSRLGRKQAAVNGLSPRTREPGMQDRAHRSINTALLQSNKTVHSEATPLLYIHPLKFLSVSTLQLFLIRLAPATISHIQHVELAPQSRHAVSRTVPIAFALLSPAVHMRLLRVPSIAWLPRSHSRDSTAFDRKLGPCAWDADMAVHDWDILVARNMAKEAYAQMFPFLASYLRSPERSKDKVGGRVAQLLRILRIFEEALQKGPHAVAGLWHKDDCVAFGLGCATAPNLAIKSAPWTTARKDAMLEEMGEEIERLVEMD